MKSISGSIALILLSATLLTAQSQNNISIVSSADAPGTISLHRLNRCYAQLAREWNLAGKDLPHVVVFHVSRKAAETAYIAEDMAIRRNTSGRDGDQYYELWLVGDPHLKYVVGLQNVLEAHFRLQPTDRERKDVMVRVARVEDATIEVQQGK